MIPNQPVVSLKMPSLSCLQLLGDQIESQVKRLNLHFGILFVFIDLSCKCRKKILINIIF